MDGKRKILLVVILSLYYEQCLMADTETPAPPSEVVSDEGTGTEPMKGNTDPVGTDQPTVSGNSGNSSDGETTTNSETVFIQTVKGDNPIRSNEQSGTISAPSPNANEQTENKPLNETVSENDSKDKDEIDFLPVENGELMKAVVKNNDGNDKPNQRLAMGVMHVSGIAKTGIMISGNGSSGSEHKPEMHESVLGSGVPIALGYPQGSPPASYNVPPMLAAHGSGASSGNLNNKTVSVKKEPTFYGVSSSNAANKYNGPFLSNDKMMRNDSVLLKNGSGARPVLKGANKSTSRTTITKRKIVISTKKNNKTPANKRKVPQMTSIKPPQRNSNRKFRSKAVSTVSPTPRARITASNPKTKSSKTGSSDTKINSRLITTRKRTFKSITAKKYIKSKNTSARNPSTKYLPKTVTKKLQ